MAPLNPALLLSHCLQECPPVRLDAVAGVMCLAGPSPPLQQSLEALLVHSRESPARIPTEQRAPARVAKPWAWNCIRLVRTVPLGLGSVRYEASPVEPSFRDLSNRTYRPSSKATNRFREANSRPAKRRMNSCSLPAPSWTLREPTNLEESVLPLRRVGLVRHEREDLGDRPRDLHGCLQIDDDAFPRALPAAEGVGPAQARCCSCEARPAPWVPGRRARTDLLDAQDLYPHVRASPGRLRHRRLVRHRLCARRAARPARLRRREDAAPAMASMRARAGCWSSAAAPEAIRPTPAPMKVSRWRGSATKGSWRASTWSSAAMTTCRTPRWRPITTPRAGQGRCARHARPPGLITPHPRTATTQAEASRAASFRPDGFFPVAGAWVWLMASVASPPQGGRKLKGAVALF